MLLLEPLASFPSRKKEEEEDEEEGEKVRIQDDKNVNQRVKCGDKERR